MRRQPDYHPYEGDQVVIWPTGTDRCVKCQLPEINRAHQEPAEEERQALPPTPAYVREAEARRFGESGE